MDFSILTVAGVCLSIMGFLLIVAGSEKLKDDKRITQQVASHNGEQASELRGRIAVRKPLMIGVIMTGVILIIGGLGFAVADIYPFPTSNELNSVLLDYQP